MLVVMLDETPIISHVIKGNFCVIIGALKIQMYVSQIRDAMILPSQSRAPASRESLSAFAVPALKINKIPGESQVHLIKAAFAGAAVEERCECHPLAKLLTMSLLKIITGPC